MQIIHSPVLNYVRFCYRSSLPISSRKPAISVASAFVIIMMRNKFLELALRLGALASLLFAMWMLLIFFRVLSHCLKGLNTLQVGLLQLINNNFFFHRCSYG